MTVLEKLDADEIVKTADVLRNRISERFPGAGLVGVAEQLYSLASRAKRTSRAIRTPNVPLRIVSYAAIALVIGASLAAFIIGFGAPGTRVSWHEMIQTAEAGINDLVLLGAAIYFAIHLETRIKRGRIVQALHELRTLSHLIDVHQLTKSPEAVADGPLVTTTKSSPVRKLTAFELGRYLDYCTEMLSLTGKIAALYGDGFDDADSIEAVTEVEELTVGLQTKIWQKLILLRMTAPQSPLRIAPALPEEEPAEVEDA